MTPVEMLERFARFAEFDPDRGDFTIPSRTYDMHRLVEMVARVSEYDPSGKLGVLYAKRSYLADLETRSVKLIDVLSDAGMLDGEREIWEMFGSDDVRTIENELAETATGLLTLMAGKPLFGEADDIAAKMVDAVETVVDGLGKCKKRVWMRDGNPVARPAELATDVNVFGSLADALMALADANDGIYLCYVKQEVSADGFFGFFLKSGGNLVSMDDYIEEPFPGAHRESRNGRYLRDKSFGLFPYKEMIEVSAPDYKGYCREYEVKPGRFSLLGFGEETCLALVLAMSCVASLFDGTVPDAGGLMYLDSFLPMRTALPESPHHEIVRAGESTIVKANSSFDLGVITTEEVLSGVFMPDDARSPFKGNTLVDEAVARYAGGFELDAAPLLASSRLAQLRSDADPGEFAATEDRMRLVAYAQAREQLASHLEAGIGRECDSMGGALGARRWFERELADRLDRIRRLCAKVYEEAAESGARGPWGHHGSFDGGRCLYWVKRPEPGLWRIMTLNGNYGPSPRGAREKHIEDRRGYPLSDEERARMRVSDYDGSLWMPDAECLLDDDGRKCNYIFRFEPCGGWDIADVLGIDAWKMPYLVRMWRSSGEMFGYSGNSLLEIVDPVKQLRNPLTPWEGGTWGSPVVGGYDFRFQIGLTKREISRLLKEA